MEGTKPYRRKIQPPPAPEHRADDAPKPAPVNDLQSDAANIDRRAWFGSLVPAFGDGLVKLLRASNNLRENLHELRRRTDEDQRK